jgi:hypothetical protein
MPSIKDEVKSIHASVRMAAESRGEQRAVKTLDQGRAAHHVHPCHPPSCVKLHGTVMGAAVMHRAPWQWKDSEKVDGCMVWPAMPRVDGTGAQWLAAPCIDDNKGDNNMATSGLLQTTDFRLAEARWRVQQ